MQYLRLLFLICLVAAQAAKAEAAGHYIGQARSDCAQYGFQPGTEGFANCVMKTTQEIRCRDLWEQPPSYRDIGDAASRSLNNPGKTYGEALNEIRAARGCPAH